MWITFPPRRCSNDKIKKSASGSYWRMEWGWQERVLLDNSADAFHSDLKELSGDTGVFTSE